MVVRVVVPVMVVMAMLGTAEARPAGPARPARPPVVPRYVTGPRLVPLGNHAEIDLPPSMILYERAEAQRLLRRVGEPVDSVVAIVQKPEASWSIIVSYTDAGYVDDADANEFDAGALLGQYRIGTRAHNERRRMFGAPEPVIDGWTERPHYERAQHRLVWGVRAHAVDGTLVNQFTRILGRDGFLSVNLIDDAETMERSQRATQAIVQAVRFQPGARYEDHAPGDRRSGAGLRNRVHGEPGSVVAAKRGLLAQAALVLAPALIIFFGLFFGIRGLLRRWSGGALRRKPRGIALVETATADATGVTGALW